MKRRITIGLGARRERLLVATAFLGAAVLVVGACGSGDRPSTGAAGTTARNPSAKWAATVDNRWFPLPRGATWVYRGEKDAERARDVVHVTDAIKVIQGVRCTVVSDRLWESGHLAERTLDYYAQDIEGTVWYFGEDTAELDATGRVTSREGTWQAGRDGAKAGIFMPADPRLGESFRQEYLKGHAEDHFQIVSLNVSVKTPAVSSPEAMLTKEWTPLEPAVLDHKLYVRGIGDVSEETVKGGNERNVLVGFRRT